MPVPIVTRPPHAAASSASPASSAPTEPVTRSGTRMPPTETAATPQALRTAPAWGTLTAASPGTDRVPIPTARALRRRAVSPAGNCGRPGW